MPSYRTPLLGALAVLLLAPTAVTAADRPGPLVNVDWLAQNKDAEDLVVLDIRSAIDGSDRGDYEAGHIPGALYSSYSEAGWRVEDADGVPGTLPPTEDLETLIGELGIDNDTHVVVAPAGVGSTDFGSAARIYWTFRVLGHDAVSILNGGHEAWVEAGHDVATGGNEPERTAEFEAEFRDELIADADAVDAAREAGVQLVDNRPAEQFAGEEQHPAAAASGTIPGAQNLAHHELTEAGSAFLLDEGSLNALMDQAGVEDDGTSITFCNTGHWAAIGWFAMSEVAGHEGVAMYDGSMVEWSRDENRPLQTARSGLGAVVDWLFN